MNIQDLLAPLNGLEKPILIDKKRTLSGRELVSEVSRYQQLLTRNGITKGVPVLLNMSNDSDSVIALLAAWSNKAVVFVSNPFTPIKKIQKTVEGFQLHAFIGSNVLVKTLAKTWDKQASHEHLAIFLGGLSLLKTSPSSASLDKANLKSAAVAIFSSGSTGEPKAILNSFANIYRNAECHGKAIGLQQDDVVACALPLYYSYGLVANLISALIYRCTITLTNLNVNFDQQWFSEQSVSVIGLTPFFAKNLVIESPSLRVMTLGGDALPIKTAKQIRQNHPNCELYSTYGLTEAGPRVATWRFDNCDWPDTQLAPLGSPLDCCTFRLSTDSLNNSRGELVISTQTKMLGYYRHGKLKMAKGKHDEVYTEDIFEMVGNDCFFVTRIKDIIVQNGEKIFPASVESHLLSIEGVLDARVIGKPDKDKGEIAEALIYVDKGVNSATVKLALMSLIPRASMPTNFYLVDDIQRTETGKKVSLESMRHIA
ncbi:MAG: acyl-CoA synthetase (AMP-forming)/AMP-acid ligase II [Arenicella sp.]|jgi:acyl-CoA synthetase (AMP-forming)/AMP-acid ligase II